MFFIKGSGYCPFTGYIGVVKDATESTARVELHSTCQTISVDRQRLTSVYVILFQVSSRSSSQQNMIVSVLSQRYSLFMKFHEKVFFLLFFFLSFFYDSVVLRDTEEWPPLMVALQCMAPRRPCMVQALVPRCMAARHPSTMVRPIKRHHLNFSLCCVFGVFFPEVCFVTGSRTPHYGSQTPLHDGSRTPGQSGAWDPNNPNTPSRQERKTRIHYKPV